MTTTKNTAQSRLAVIRNIVAAIPEVAAATVRAPSAELIALCAKFGDNALPTLDVTVRGSERSLTFVKKQIEEFGLECRGEGGSDIGPVLVFVLRTV